MVRFTATSGEALYARGKKSCLSDSSTKYSSLMPGSLQQAKKMAERDGLS